MNGNNVVTMHFTDRQMTGYQADGYDFLPGGRWERLQRLAWRFLVWSKAITVRQTKQFDFHSVRIDLDKVTKAIQEAYHRLLQRGVTPTKVLLGHKQFDQLVCSPELHSAWRNGSSFSVTTLYGMDIQIVPWMDGLLVL